MADLLVKKKEEIADRKAELERKRQKLALLREEKERRKREKETQEKNAEQNANSFKRSKDVLMETDVLLASLDVKSAFAPSPSSVEPSLNGNSVNKPTSPDVSPVKPKRKVNLSMMTVHRTSVPPSEKDVYTKQTQTIQSGPIDKDHGGPIDYYEWEDEFQVLAYDESSASEESENLSLESLETKNQRALGQEILKIIKQDNNKPLLEQLAESIETFQGQIRSKETNDIKVELSDEEKLVIMRKQSFRTFVDKSARIMERALSEDVNIFVDYTGEREDVETEDRSGMSLSLNRCFFNEELCKNRTITAFDWSVQFPELLCASYNQNDDAPQLADGLCLIWNIKFKKSTPEFVFHCQSPITSACFAKFHPNLVIGGTYSGQIVLWDNRSNKRTPVQRSPLSAIAHTHPVYSINMVGSQNAHNLVTISTDGKCCTWSVDMLSAPQDVIELNQQKQSKTVAVTCLAFPNEDYNNFIVGSEDGTIYSGCRHGNKAGINEVYDAHQGPITAIGTHRSKGPTEFSDLFLSSSFDWTVKLWSSKSNQPLYSFEHNSDYVFDVSWSPVHPALFACIDGLGNLDMWNLNRDTELPTASTVVEGSPALNKLSWTQNGNHVAVGDALGKIWIYDLGEQLSHPKPDDWFKFSEVLGEIQEEQTFLDGDSLISPVPLPTLSFTPSSPFVPNTPTR